MSFGFGFGLPSQIAAEGGATLNLNFAGATSLDPKITFTRASTTATYTNSSGLIATASTDVPRFDYDPVTLQPKGLLIEEQRTNLLTYSEQFDNAAWTKTNSTVTANAVAAPDGTTTAEKLAETATTGQHLVQQSATVIAASSYNMSIYAKAAERSIIRITDIPSTAAINVDLSLGSIVSSSLVTNPQVTFVGNGWYRISGSFTSAGTTSTITAYPVVGGTSSYLGVVGNGFYLWGAQLEAGAFATSYIPTVASQVTRAADNASMTGTNFSSWFNQSEFSAYFEATRIGLDATKANGVFAFYNATTSGLSDSFLMDCSSPIAFYGNTAGTVQFNISLGNNTPGTYSKVAGAYKTNDVQAAANGVLGTADTSALLPVFTGARIGVYPNGTANYLNGWVRSITYWPRRLSNTELQSVTA